MRKLLNLAPLFAALLLAGCATGRALNPFVSDDGPGVGCDTCATTEARPMSDAWPYAVDPNTASAAAAASGGQRASNQPVQSDPTAITPFTTWNRGAGANTATNHHTNVRSQSGAPSVNQSLLADALASSDAQANDGGVCGGGGSGYLSPAVVQIERTLDELREQLRQAVTPEDRAPIREEIRHYMDRLVAASADTRRTVQVTYNMQGQRVIQVVANGSKAGDPNGPAIDPDAAAAVANAFSKAAEANQGAPDVLIAPDDPVGTLAPAAPTTVSPLAMTFVGSDGEPIADFRPVAPARLSPGGGS